MHLSSNGEKLTDKRYITLILRLLIDSDTTQVRGEVVDVSAKKQHPFSGWRELFLIMREIIRSSTFEEP
jgi:hypothetical protein